MATKNANINHIDLDLKQQLVEATDAVRQKFNSMKSREAENKSSLHKFYAPVIEPLKTIAASSAKQPSTSTTIKTVPTRLFATSFQTSTPEKSKNLIDSNFFETPSTSFSLSDTITNESEINLDEISNEHIKKLRMNHPDYDTMYGVRIDPVENNLKLGKFEVHFQDGKLILSSGDKKIKMYQGSPQLYDLIFLKDPGLLDTEVDRKIFTEIINLSKLAYVNFDMRSGLNVSNTKKFRLISQSLVKSPNFLRKKITGTGNRKSIEIPKNRIYKKRHIEYVYWNNIRELIKRLRLLWSSKLAGHTGHDNEILSIIEELREEGVIY